MQCNFFKTNWFLGFMVYQLVAMLLFLVHPPASGFCCNTVSVIFSLLTPGLSLNGILKLTYGYALLLNIVLQLWFQYRILYQALVVFLNQPGQQVLEFQFTRFHLQGHFNLKWYCQFRDDCFVAPAAPTRETLLHPSAAPVFRRNNSNNYKKGYHCSIKTTPAAPCILPV